MRAIDWLKAELHRGSIAETDRIAVSGRMVLVVRFSPPASIGIMGAVGVNVDVCWWCGKTVGEVISEANSEEVKNDM